MSNRNVHCEEKEFWRSKGFSRESLFAQTVVYWGKERSVGKGKKKTKPQNNQNKTNPKNSKETNNTGCCPYSVYIDAIDIDTFGQKVIRPLWGTTVRLTVQLILSFQKKVPMLYESVRVA